MKTRLVEFELPDGTLAVVEVPIDMDDEAVERLIQEHLKAWKADGPKASAASEEDVDEWALRREARTDFFATRPRQPHVVRSRGWASTVGARLTRAGRRW